MIIIYLQLFTILEEGGGESGREGSGICIRASSIKRQ